MTVGENVSDVLATLADGLSKVAVAVLKLSQLVKREVK